MIDKIGLRILTKNERKAGEFQALFENTRYRIIADSTPISEIQTEDMDELVTDKVIKASPVKNFQPIDRESGTANLQ